MKSTSEDSRESYKSPVLLRSHSHQRLLLLVWLRHFPLRHPRLTRKMKSTSEDGRENYKSPGLLNIYDLTPIDCSYWFGFGIFHSGIEVHGMEYGYGAHEYPSSGVFEVEPRSCPGFIYRCSILLGHTTMPPAEFQAFLENMASDYHGDTYHLISKNCNHFTDDLSLRLTGKPIPGWINRLARLGALCSCLLPDSLQVSVVKQLPEYHGCSEEDGYESQLPTPCKPTESDDADQDRFLSSSAEDGDDVLLNRLKGEK